MQIILNLFSQIVTRRASERRTAILLPRLLFGLLLLFAATISVSAHGQDTLILNTRDGRTTKRTGQITEWTGATILLSTGGRTRKVDSTTVADIQTNWPADLAAARQLMLGGKYAEAIPRLQAAANNENRKWVKSIITAELLQCFDAVDKPEQATIEFLKLYSADSDTRFFHLIPLAWASSNLHPPSAARTAQWLGAKNGLLKLIGASWQLTGSESQNAVAALEQLSADADKRIAQLATTQLWRTQVLSADQQLTGNWERQVGKLIPELRPGPLLVLAEAQSRIDNGDLALINLMKMPILYPEKKSLTALALYRSGSILQDKGNTEQAKQVWRELLRDYSSSQHADSARQK